MDIIILIILIVIVYLFILYIPTILFYNYSKSKRRNYSPILFFGSSLLFIIFDYLCVMFYDLKSFSKLSECTKSLVNYSCFFNKYLSRMVTPSFTLYAILIFQVLSFVLYSYITSKFILRSQKIKSVPIYLLLFYLCGILCTCIHYAVLSNVNFYEGSFIVSIIGTNIYVILPFIYLMITTIINKDMIELKRKNSIKKIK